MLPAGGGAARSAIRALFAQHRMPQRRHALAVDATRCLSRIVQRYQRVVVAAVALGEVLRAAVGGERPDVPRADAEDVGHGGEVRAAGAAR